MSSREQLAGFVRVALVFGDLMYEMLILRTDSAIVVSTFVAQLLSRSMDDFDTH